MTTVGILHPGSMGAAVAGELSSRGATVLWCPTGRSDATRRRAERFGLQPARDLDELLDQSSFVVSLCPPASAESVARSVAARRFRGLYLEANAISPERMNRIADILSENGATVVDGGVVGSPPSPSRSPLLYLSGASDDVTVMADLFADTRVQTRELPGGIGQASGLKLAYTTYQKASRALAAVAHALADEYGVTAGPMTGFDADGINAAFFGDTPHQVLAVVNLGQPGEGAWFDRLPRLEFDEVVTTA